MSFTEERLFKIMRKFDMNIDGRITSEEISQVSDMLELGLREEKADTQRKMAWTAMVSMGIFTVVLFSPLITDSRVAALADLLGLFYIAQAGVVGAYMGVTTWLSNTSTRSRYHTNPMRPVNVPTDSELNKSVVAPDPDHNISIKGR